MENKIMELISSALEMFVVQIKTYKMKKMRKIKLLQHASAFIRVKNIRKELFKMKEIHRKRENLRKTD